MAILHPKQILVLDLRMSPGSAGPAAIPRSFKARCCGVTLRGAGMVTPILLSFELPCELQPCAPRKERAPGSAPILSASRSARSNPGDCPENAARLRCPLTISKLGTRCPLPAFVNRGPDDCGANSSNVAALYCAAYYTRDNSCAVPPSNACRRGLRGHPNRDNRGGPDHRLSIGRWPLELWLRPQLALVQ